VGVEGEEIEQRRVGGEGGGKNWGRATCVGTMLHKLNSSLVDLKFLNSITMRILLTVTYPCNCWYNYQVVDSELSQVVSVVLGSGSFSLLIQKLRPLIVVIFQLGAKCAFHGTWTQ
jgi:hypothetical protein